MEASTKVCPKDRSGQLSKRVMRAWTEKGIVKESTTNQMMCLMSLQRNEILQPMPAQNNGLV